MTELIAEKTFEAILRDDAVSFGALMEKDRIGAYRYGRFPVLSLMYLFKSKKLIKRYEEEFIKITSFTEKNEPVTAFSEFKKIAGKCLRLYFSEIVSPLEMLLISDDIRRLKRIYPLAKPSEDIKKRLKEAYFIRYGLNVKYENGRIILDRRPLSKARKRKIIAVCAGVFFAVAITVLTPSLAISLMPKPVEGDVTELSQIDFSSKKKYTLKNDLVLPENYSVERVNCSIDGGGKKLIFKSGATLGALYGKFYNAEVETSGDKPVFTLVAETAEVENIVLKVNADFTAEESVAFLAKTNLGTVEKVTLGVSGKMGAYAEQNGEEAIPLTFGGIVQNNYYKYNSQLQTTYRGTVRDCTATYDGFSLTGTAGANPAFGGITGLNYGTVQGCTVSGNISGDTFDIAGICVENQGLLSDVKNTAELYQTSRDTGWNTVTCGIVITNGNVVENCENSGNITALSECGDLGDTEREAAVSASGIVYMSDGYVSSLIIRGCKNTGTVTAGAKYRNAYASGVCILNASGIISCSNYGKISASAENGKESYTGGISAFANGYIVMSENDADINSFGSKSYIGGIAAKSVAQIYNCISQGNVSASADEAYAGGILGFGAVVRVDGPFYSSLHSASIESCISKSAIKAVTTDEGTAYVGGIAGFFAEEKFDTSGETVVYSSRAVGSYFIGNIEADGYSGNIVGAVGINIYESNLFISNGNEIPYFEENFYVSNLLTAFGSAKDGDGNFTSIADKGAESKDRQEIEADEKYKKILDNLTAERKK